MFNKESYQTVPLRQISTVLIVQDEEDRIASAIRSCLSFSDEIVLVDGGSQDSTAQIAAEFGCCVYHHEWSGYAAQRNFGAEQAKHHWIFFIDADEVVDEQLEKALMHWKDQPNLEANAFSVQRIGNFWDIWFDSCPEQRVRLYNKTVFQMTDVLVHEVPNVGNERVIPLPGVVWHHGFRSIQDLVNRFNRYTDLDAQQAYLTNVRFSWVRLLLKPPAKFMQQYFWHKLYQKGTAGFASAALWSYYIFLKEIKLYEIEYLSQQKKKS
ncbi:MAG: glycosyltransferase family 2 protein [Oscillatoriales cyanobacterium C42_A2020_001]|nr:glycosyltransferase family 2 protein [Leptolyngbyaceae cyanobacterium C42_A2020_001]